MSVGDRHGTTTGLQRGRELQDTFKADLMAAVEADILRHLEDHDEWRNDDLTVLIPADSLNVPGSVVARLVNTGRIVETGRRASTDPERKRATRCRKSGVYRLAGSGTDGRDVSKRAESVVQECSPLREAA